MLRDYCRSSGESNSGVDDNYDIQLKIKPGIFDSLLSSSAFRSFEVAICQFQKLNINGMTLNSRVVFFCNLYNIITGKYCYSNNITKTSIFTLYFTYFSSLYSCKKCSWCKESRKNCFYEVGKI